MRLALSYHVCTNLGFVKLMHVPVCSGLPGLAVGHVGLRPGVCIVQLNCYHAGPISTENHLHSTSSLAESPIATRNRLVHVSQKVLLYGWVRLFNLSSWLPSLRVPGFRLLVADNKKDWFVEESHPPESLQYARAEDTNCELL